MTDPFYPENYPPDLTEEQSKFLTSTVKDWSIAHGLAVRPTTAFAKGGHDPNGALAITAPVTLFPSLFPLNCFHETLMIQTAYNELYAAVARDEKWLGEVIEELAGIDDFIAQLWNIHVTVKKESYVQDLSLGLFRSDYMVHMDPQLEIPKPQIRQVEFNTMASSFGGLASRTSSLHRYLLQSAAYPKEAATDWAKPHGHYGPSKSGRLLCVLFVVQDPERNIFDQKHLEYALFSYSRVKAFRLPFARILQDTQLDHDRNLIYTSPAFPDRTYEVTTVYYRAGYSPSEYTTPSAWSARLHIERSAAIKCPSILSHLAGSKKVQQILATPDSPHLLRFLPYEGIAGRIKNSFAPMYPLDTSAAGLEARKLATDPVTAARFVLKPQREGGGNNIYRKAIPEFLEKLPEAQWPAYILMEMIEPPAQRNYILRNGEVEQGGVICELGVFGTCLWRHGNGGGEGGDKGEVIENDEAGYLLRTKGDQSEEGGVAAGFGALDSCILVDL